MPKIIPDIESKIEQGALSLFNQYDYDQVDMKMIAKECQIAVGTLYNYFPNKRQLFIHVLAHTWQATSFALDEIYEAYELPEEKLSHSIEQLYDDISFRRGTAKYIYKLVSNLEYDDEILDLFDILFNKVERLFEPFEKKTFSCDEELINKRLAKSLILLIQNTIIAKTGLREDNLHFIQDFFYNSLHVDMNLKKKYLISH